MKFARISRLAQIRESRIDISRGKMAAVLQASLPGAWVPRGHAGTTCTELTFCAFVQFCVEVVLRSVLVWFSDSEFIPRTRSSRSGIMEV